MPDEALASPPLNSQIDILVDWVEFNVLASEYKVFRLLELTRLSDEEQEEENQDVGEQDNTNEQIYEAVVAELAFRMDCLSTAYPFLIEGSDLKLVDELNEGCYVYLYCLFFSHVNCEEALVLNPPHENSDRDILQICSTFAAASIVNGNSVSFGFPRVDNSNFLDALTSTYEKFGEGEVVVAIPPGAPAYEKDGRIDVIAWGNSLDGAPGTAYLLGQVASGKNWEGKSIRGDIEFFHETWFVHKPPSEVTTAMFIPFCINVRSGSTFNETMTFLVAKYGYLSYRYRLPKEAENGIHLSRVDANYIERVEEFSKVKDYVDNFMVALSG